MSTSSDGCRMHGTPSAKRFATVQAQFAMRGRELVRSVRVGDDRVSYIVSRAGDARYFSHWHDVEAHLRAVTSASPTTLAVAPAGAGGRCPWWVPHRPWRA